MKTRRLIPNKAEETGGVKVSEATFQRQVLQLAALTGWRSFHARKSRTAKGAHITAVAGDGIGFPDLVLVREKVLFVELKALGGKLRPEQAQWRDALLAAGAEWRYWTPGSWREIEHELKRGAKWQK